MSYNDVCHSVATGSKALTDEQIARIEHLTDMAGEKLSAHMLVEDARDPDSPLHELFEWDLEIAAMRHWLERARQIIRTVTVRYELTTYSREVTSVAYVRDPAAEHNEQGYVRIESVRTDKQAGAAVGCEEMKRIASGLRRCSGIFKALSTDEEMASFSQHVERLLSDTNSIVSKLEKMM